MQKKIIKVKLYFLGPRGKTFNQEIAKELSKEENLIFLCGHYEGIDERVYKYIDMEISLGDFVLTGGEMAAIPVIDCILRLEDLFQVFLEKKKVLWKNLFIMDY